MSEGKVVLTSVNSVSCPPTSVCSMDQSQDPKSMHLFTEREC